MSLVRVSLLHKLVLIWFKILRPKFIFGPGQFSPDFLLKPNWPMSLSPLSSFFPCLRSLLFPMFLLPFLLFKCHFPYSLTSFHVDHFSYFYHPLSLFPTNLSLLLYSHPFTFRQPFPIPRISHSLSTLISSPFHSSSSPCGHTSYTFAQTSLQIFLSFSLKHLTPNISSLLNVTLKLFPLSNFSTPSSFMPQKSISSYRHLCSAAVIIMSYEK